jgi:hypothetical protein
MSWLMVSSRIANATGKECARIIPRTTISRAPGGIIFADESSKAAEEMWSIASAM